MFVVIDPIAIILMFLAAYGPIALAIAAPCFAYLYMMVRLWQLQWSRPRQLEFVEMQIGQRYVVDPQFDGPSKVDWRAAIGQASADDLYGYYYGLRTKRQHDTAWLRFMGRYQERMAWRSRARDQAGSPVRLRDDVQ